MERLSSIKFRFIFALLSGLSILISEQTSFAQKAQPISANNPENIQNPTDLPTPTPTQVPVNTTTTTTNTSNTTTYSCEFNRIDAQFYQDWYRGGLNFVLGDNRSPSCIVSRMHMAFNECTSLMSTITDGFRYIDDCIAWKIFGARIYSVEQQVKKMVPVETDNDPYNLGNNASYDYTFSMFSTSYIEKYVWEQVVGDDSIRYGKYYDWATYSNNTKTISIVTETVNLQEILPTWGINEITNTLRETMDNHSTLYIRKNKDGTCSAVSTNAIPKGSQVCYAGTFSWYVSPISLLWDDGVDIDRDLRITRFPLDLGKSNNNWYIWKASARAPLLVFDPEHNGKITSATQLFGNWTFGGRKNIALKGHNNSMSDEIESMPPWKNGYEALATIDANNDGEISGSELLPLALWFDENRNGISDLGEVKTLKEVGVTTLYFQPDQQQSATGSLFAKRGFKRIVDGAVVAGTSVDWKSDSASSKAELINKHLALASACPANQSLEIDSESFSETKEADERAKAKFTEVSNRKNSAVQNPDIPSDQDNISGLWIWKSVDQGQIDTHNQPEGFLGFKDEMDGKIKGHSYTSFGVENKAAGFDNIFSSHTLNGTKTKQKDGTILIKFSIKPDDTSVLNSEATYNPKNQKLIGKTFARVALGTKPLDMTYHWIAVRQRLLGQTE